MSEHTVANYEAICWEMVYNYNSVWNMSDLIYALEADEAEMNLIKPSK